MTVTAPPMQYLRPLEDYQSGPVLVAGTTEHPVYKIRCADDAQYLFSHDDDGGVTQNIHVLAHMLRMGGVPGVPEDHAEITEVYQFPWGQGRCPVMGQPTKHDTMIKHIDRYLGKQAVDQARSGIRHLAAELLDELLPVGGGELDAARFARRLAFRSIALMTGFPCSQEVEGRLIRMFDDFTLRPSVAIIPLANAEEREFIDGLLNSGASGLIADIKEAEKTGDLSYVEALSLVRGTWYAGTDTAGATIATILSIFGSPDYHRYQVEARSLTGAEQQRMLNRCARETTRLWPPLPEIPMVTYEEIHLPSGFVIPAGKHVLLELSAINRDERLAGDDPGEFIPDRPKRRNFSFGNGLHSCAGKYPALVTIEEGVAEVLDRTSEILLASDGWSAVSGLVTYVDRARLNCVVS